MKAIIRPWQVLFAVSAAILLGHCAEYSETWPVESLPTGTALGSAEPQLEPLAPIQSEKTTPESLSQSLRDIKHRFSRVVRASWYGSGFRGRRTASGERYDPNGLTAASPNLPFGSLVEVTSLSSGKHVVVRINDRSARRNRRGIDLSRRAAREIGLVAVGRVRITEADAPLEAYKSGYQEECSSPSCVSVNRPLDEPASYVLDLPPP